MCELTPVILRMVHLSVECFARFFFRYQSHTHPALLCGCFVALVFVGLW